MKILFLILIISLACCTNRGNKGKDSINENGYEILYENDSTIHISSLNNKKIVTITFTEIVKPCPKDTIKYNSLLGKTTMSNCVYVIDSISNIEIFDSVEYDNLFDRKMLRGLLRFFPRFTLTNL